MITFNPKIYCLPTNHLILIKNNTSKIVENNRACLLVIEAFRLISLIRFKASSNRIYYMPFISNKILQHLTAVNHGLKLTTIPSE